MPDGLNPDPTVLTTEAMARGLAAERDYVDGQLQVVLERLRGIDTATKLLNEGADRVPHAVTEEVKHLRELMEEKFTSVETQFRERDTRQEREAKDNQIRVDAAFAAQKESAAEQNKSNTLAITKSEIATTETINKLSELFRTTIDALSSKIDDLKERVRGMESVKQGYTESRSEGRSSLTTTTAVIAAVVGGLLLLITFYNLVQIHNGQTGTPAPAVTVPAK